MDYQFEKVNVIRLVAIVTDGLSVLLVNNFYGDDESFQSKKRTVESGRNSIKLYKNIYNFIYLYITGHILYIIVQGDSRLGGVSECGCDYRAVRNSKEIDR